MLRDKDRSCHCALTTDCTDDTDGEHPEASYDPRFLSVMRDALVVPAVCEIVAHTTASIESEIRGKAKSEMMD